MAAIDLGGLPPIKVVGVGGGGCNAVNRMVEARIQGVQFVGVNTDGQALMRCEAESRIRIGDRHWRVRGLERNQGADQLRVNLRVLCEDAFHIDSLDLYVARQRLHFVKEAAAALGIGSCPVTLHREPCARERLHVPEGHGCRYALAFGYPDLEGERQLRRGVRSAIPRGRKPLGSLVHYGRFGEQA